MESTGSDEDLKYREWTIALGATTAVFLVTTLLLACILFVVVCRKIVRLKNEREARVTGIVEGRSSYAKFSNIVSRSKHHLW